MAVISHIRIDPRTQDYITRRTVDGLSGLEIMRWLNATAPARSTTCEELRSRTHAR